MAVRLAGFDSPNSFEERLCISQDAAFTVLFRLLQFQFRGKDELDMLRHMTWYINEADEAFNSMYEHVLLGAVVGALS